MYVAMPPLYRIDVGKDVFYALDEDERQGVMDRIKAEKRTAKVSVTRFKGLGEMNPLQLRETVMDRDTRRLIHLVDEDQDDTVQGMDLLLSKKRASDRRVWLSRQGTSRTFLSRITATEVHLHLANPKTLATLRASGLR